MTTSIKETLSKESFIRAVRIVFPRNRLLVMVACYTVIMSIVTIEKHRLFLSTAYDLGIFNQVFWSTIHGRPFHYTVEPWFGTNFLGVHFSPILVLLIPFYAVYPHPESLLCLQSFIIAVGVVPLYHLAKDLLDERYATVLGILYLASPATIGANQFDFHVEAFIPVTILSAIYFLHKKNLKFYIVSVILSLMSLEYVGFLVILMPIRELIIKRKAEEEFKTMVHFTVLTILLSIFWLFLAFTTRYFLRPAETRGQGILIPVLSKMDNPFLLLSYIISDPYRKLSYLLLLLGPLLFTPVFSSYFILTVPWLLVAFALNYGAYYSIGNQYSLVVAPFIFASLAYGIKRILCYTHFNRKSFATIILVCALISSALSVSVLKLKLAGDLERNETISQIISLVPEDASILTINRFQPHLSHRFDVWVLRISYSEPFPNYDTGISTIWKEYTPNFLRKTTPDFVLLDLTIEGAEAQNINLIISELLARESYGVYASAEGVLLLKRAYVGNPAPFSPLTNKFNYRNLTIYDGSEVEDLTSRSGRVLAHTDKNDDNTTFWESPCTFLTKGKYCATFRLKVTGNVYNGDIITLEIVTEKEMKVVNSTVLHTEDVEQEIWQEFTFNFQINESLINVRFRGVRVSNRVNLSMDYVSLVQLSC